MKINTTTFSQLVARRVSKGADEATSVVILNQILHSHEGDNLVHALCYNSFATEAQATKIVKAGK